jgi:5'(3')-deoxyribonucleotidase
MDDVLVDWKSAITKICKNFWDIDDEKKRFFLLVEAGREFWANNPWTNDGKDLWNSINIYRPILLSAAARGNYTVNENVKNGKLDWIKNNLGLDFSKNAIICHRKEKKLYSNNNSILIDDFEKNIEEWEENGGIGILHKSSSDTIKKLTRIYNNVR